MLKLNRTTEYGLMALSYIRGKASGELTSAREIATNFDLPFEILAKTLQRLKEQGLITSTYGTRGGYVLSKDLTKINLLDFLRVMEGPVGVVSCVTTTSIPSEARNAENNCCEYSGSCSIRPIMSHLNDRMYEFMSRISLDELTRVPLKSKTVPEFTAEYIGEEP